MPGSSLTEMGDSERYGVFLPTLPAMLTPKQAGPSGGQSAKHPGTNMKPTGLEDPQAIQQVASTCSDPSLDHILIT